MVVHDLELADVAVLHHHRQEADDHLNKLHCYIQLLLYRIAAFSSSEKWKSFAFSDNFYSKFTLIRIFHTISGFLDTAWSQFARFWETKGVSFKLVDFSKSRNFISQLEFRRALVYS